MAGELTKAQVQKAKKGIYDPKYVERMPDSDAVGIMVSRYFKWDPTEIMRMAYSAFEDANMHAENRELEKIAPWAFEKE